MLRYLSVVLQHWPTRSLPPEHSPRKHESTLPFVHAPNTRRSEVTKPVRHNGKPVNVAGRARELEQVVDFLGRVFKPEW
jgi:hypothetical protein